MAELPPALEQAADDLSGLVGQIASPALSGEPFGLQLATAAVDPSQALAGRYFLARCSEAVGVNRQGDWSIYLRRPLFVCGCQPRGQAALWQVIPAGGPEPGRAWLAQRPAGSLLNLLGPLGNGFRVWPHIHNLLVVCDWADDPVWFWQLLALCEPTLDQGGRVTLLLHTGVKSGPGERLAGLLARLPIQVEVRLAADESAWQEQLAQTAGWADQICAGVPAGRYAGLLAAVQAARFRVEPGFAQVLVRADLLCGVGACLACAVPTARGGVTRACVHGPVFDLLTLAGG